MRLRVGLAAILAGTLVAFAAVAGRWFGLHWLRDAVEAIVRRDLAEVFLGDVRLGSVEVRVNPPGVVVRDLAIEAPGLRPILAAERLEIRIRPWASLWEGAWVADLRFVRPEISYDPDSPQWAHALSASGGTSGLLPRRVELHEGSAQARLPYGVSVGLQSIRLRARVSRGIRKTRWSFGGTSRGSIARLGERVTVDRVVLRGEAVGETLRIVEARFEGEGGRVEGRAEIRPGEWRAEVDSRLQLDRWGRLFPEAELRGGVAAVTARLRGPVSALGVDSRFEVTAVGFRGLELTGVGTLRTQAADWTLSVPRLALFGGEFEGEARGRFGPEFPYSASLRFRDADPRAVLGFFGVPARLRGSGSGEATVEGRLFGPSLRGSGIFSLRDGSQALSGEAKFAAEAGEVQLDGALQGGHEDRLLCRYSSRPERIEGDCRLEARSLRTFSRFLELDADGSGEIRAELGGTADRPHVRGDAALQAFRWQDLSLGEVRGTWEVDAGAFRSAGLSLAGGALRFSGSIPWSGAGEHRWTLSGRDLPGELARAALRWLRPEVPRIDGEFDLEAAVQGRGEAIGGSVRVQGRRVVVAGERLGSIWVDVSRGAREWEIRGRIEGHAASGRFSVAADPEGRLRGQIEGFQGLLEETATLREHWPGLAGRWEAAGRIGGTRRDPEVAIDLKLREWSFGGEALPAATASLRWTSAAARVEASSGERWLLVGEISTSPPYPFQVEARWKDADLATLALPGRGLESRSRGRVRLRGDRSRPLGDGLLEIDSLSLGRGALRLAAIAPFQVPIRDGSLEIPSVVLQGEPHRLTVSGRIGLGRSAIRAEGTGDLGLAEALFPEIASARGPLEVRLEATRDPEGPWRVFGDARFRDAAVDIGLWVGIEGMSGRLVFDGDRTVLREVTGRLGGGEFLVEGSVDPRRGFDLGWALRDASLGIPDWLDYRASGNGSVTGPLGAPTLTGEIEVTRAVYDRDFEWAEFLPWFRREAERSRAQAHLPVRLDLRLFADGGLFVDNNLVQAELAGELRVRGEGPDLSWAGRLEVLGGQFLFRQRRFEITSGSVRFDEARPLDPEVEFRGETTVDTGDADYGIQVEVSGTAEHPRVLFRADDPTLTENDVLALVTFGRTVAQLRAAGAGIELGEVLALTAGPRANGVEERIYSLLPVDRIEIQPAFSRTSGTTEPRLSIGKDLTRSLRAVLGTGLGSERQQDVSLEYRLTPRISVQAAWESQTKSDAGAFGADVKFRLPFRRIEIFSLFGPGRRGW